MKLNLKDRRMVILILLFIMFFSLFYGNSFLLNLKYKNKYFSVKKVGNMIVPRSYHQSSLLKDGKILITGGYNSSSQNGLNTTEIFDLNSKKITKGPIMNLPHFNHRQFTLKTGEVVIVDVNGIEIYNPETKKFVLFDAKLEKRYSKPWLNSLNYLLLSNDNILVTGGIIRTKKNTGFDFKTINTAELIDTKKHTVIKLIGMTSPRSNHSTILDGNGKAFIVSGINQITLNNTKRKVVFNDTTECFDEKTKTFSPYKKLKTPSALPFLFVQNGHLMVFDGLLQPFNNSDFPINKSSIEILNTVIDGNTKIINLGKNIWSDSLHSYLFNLENNCFMSIFFNTTRNNPDVKTYIYIFNPYSKQTVKNESIIQPYGHILQMNKSDFLITGGEDFKENPKNNLFKKILLGSLSSDTYNNETDFYIFGNVKSSKDIYVLKINNNNLIRE